MNQRKHLLENLVHIRKQIEKATATLSKSPADINFVIVTKTQNPILINDLLIEGHSVFGENQVAEAMKKWPSLKQAFPRCKLHLIGPLQSNKVKKAVSIFDTIETIDREKIAIKVSNEIREQNRSVDCYIQINTGEEPQKAGVLPIQADQFIHECIHEIKLPIIGLMCVPPVGEDPVSHFKLLAKIAYRNGLKVLSMGMSGDFISAIKNGSTEIRIGTGIFGHRGNFK